MTHHTGKIDTLRRESVSDGVFITFASPEERWLGAANIAKEYSPRCVCIFVVDDEPNERRSVNIARFRNLFRSAGRIEEIATRHSDPLIGLDSLSRILEEVGGTEHHITIDVSTFPKDSLLLTLRALEMIPGVTTIRAVYTEPERYDLAGRDGRSFGLRRTRVVPTFAAPLRPGEELVLIILLGYEGDRAVGLWQRMQPHRTMAVIGRPTYRPEWEGDCERINAPLLATLEQKDIFYVDPRKPREVSELLKEKLTISAKPENYFIAPLGTKPEVIGLYLFAREFPELATIVYASPVNPDHQYIAHGIGPTLELATWGGPNNEP